MRRPESPASRRVKKRSRSAAVDTIAPAAHADLAVRSLVSVRLPVAMPSRSGRSWPWRCGPSTASGSKVVSSRPYGPRICRSSIWSSAGEARTLQDHAEDEVVRARVRVAGRARLPVRDADESARIELAAQERRIGGVVEEAGPVREQLADRDLGRVADEVRLEVGHGLVEREDAAIGQIERQRGDEGLRDAADAEAVVDGRLALGELAYLLAVPQPHDHARNAALDNRCRGGVERSR